MNSNYLAGVTTALLLLVSTGCAGDEEQTVRIIEPSGASVALAAQGPIDRAGAAVLAIRRAGAFNSFLTDGKGRALYAFTADADVIDSACTGECAEAWPPLLTRGEPLASQPEVDEHLVGTIELEDESLQVTYGGWPLYYFAGDGEAGETSGHGADAFDGEWYLIDPEGQPISESIETY